VSVVCDFECLSLVESRNAWVFDVDVVHVNERLLVVSYLAHVGAFDGADAELADDVADVVRVDSCVDVWEHDCDLGRHFCAVGKSAF